MIVFSLFSLTVKLFRNIKVRKLSWLNEVSVNLKSKCTEVFIIDSSSSLNIFLDVLSKSFDDQMELGFGVERLHSFESSWLRLEMSSRVVIGMFDNPNDNERCIPRKYVVVVHFINKFYYFCNLFIANVCTKNNSKL